MVKIKNISEKETKAIVEYEKILLNKYPNRLAKIILFGSKARGDAHPGADIDLLVVLKRNGKKIRREIVELTHEPILHFKVLLSPIIVEEGFFREWSPLFEHIKKDGITIWTNKRAKRNM